MKDKILAIFGGKAGLKGCFIAGGAITSLVTNKPINDWDIYPKSAKARDEALVWMYDSGYWNAHVSSRALTFVNSDSTVQIMLFDTFETTDKIFNFFDFTVCMGAFDLDTEKFAFHENFLLHCSQRFLSFNINTKFPYASAWRVRKYEEKGYTIGKMEYFKILMACQKSPINSWDDLKEQVGGVYGESMEIPTDEDFSFQGAIKVISNMRPIGPTGGYATAEEAIASTSSREILYYHNPDNLGRKYFVKMYEDSDEWIPMSVKPLNGKQVGIEAIFPEPIFYKKVKMKDGELVSLHYPKFKYTVGEEVSSGSPYIYCFQSLKSAKNYGHSMTTSPKIIKLLAKHEDIVYDGQQPRLKKALVVEIIEDDLYYE